MGPHAQIIKGDRLHLQHGPIDLIIGADGDRLAALDAAQVRFATVLAELVEELPDLRSMVRPDTPRPLGETARLMYEATQPHCMTFVTPMAAVAGAVADTVLAAMKKTAITRAYVNNGGDIALHLTSGNQFDLGLAGLNGTALGKVTVSFDDPVRGIATSGQGGRSFSLGIACSVTVLAQNAAAADAAATLIANAIDLPGHPNISRVAACEIQPDSDLGALPVVTHVGQLSPSEVTSALTSGGKVAQSMRTRGLIHSAALFLRGETLIIGPNQPFAMAPKRNLLDA